MASAKEVTEAFQSGKLAGIAEEHVRGLRTELDELRKGQAAILIKLDTLDNWRWFVVGIASAIAFMISLVVESAKNLWK